MELRAYPKLGFSTPYDKCFITSMVPVISPQTTRLDFSEMNWNTAHSSTCKQTQSFPQLSANAFCFRDQIWVGNPYPKETQ